MKKKSFMFFFSIIKLFIKKTIVFFRLNDFLYYLLLPIRKKTIICDYNNSYKHLLSVHKEPKSDVLSENEIVEPIYDLKIIVPVYNTKDYLTDCIESIISQRTTYRYKIVIIDDGSTDGSELIVDKYKTNCLIEVVHQENKGVASRRNIGLEKLDSTYICFVDSDDLMAPDFIQSYLDNIILENADIIEGSCCNLINNKITMHHFYTHKKVSYSHQKLTGFPWGKIFKSSLFKNVIFPEEFWFEDTCLRLIVFQIAKKIVYMPKIGYYYRSNQKGLTSISKSHEKSLDTFWITKMLFYSRKNYKILNNSTYVEDLLNQFVVNYQRTNFFDERIKRELFQVSKELLDNIDFSSIKVKKHKLLYKAIKNNDFGAYLLYMKTR